jgi:two-component system, OmpR family, phosphate regulon sensor histidine kinase PhoR
VRSRVFFKLMGAFLLVIAVTALILDVSVRRAWERSQTEEIKNSLTRKTQLVAQRVQNDRSAAVQELAIQEARAAQTRVTVVDSTGDVLADSEADPATMENHAGRPEFKAALGGQVGSDVRSSRTVGIAFMYVAVPISGGAVRLAYPLASIQRDLAEIRRELLLATWWACMAALALALLFAASVARRLKRIVTFAGRIAEGDFTARLEEASFDEIAHVSSALDATARKLEESFHAIEVSRGQMQTLLESIPDIVMAVSPDLKLQWVNVRFAEVLGTPARLGQPLVESLRDPQILLTTEESLRAHEARRAKIVGLLPGQSFNASTAPMPGGGVVVILQDISDVERVEKTRRDFIANVSHELRTPLTSIQGYVETLQDQDGNRENHYLEVIQKNAVRMSRLTEDLLTLARVESGEYKLNLQALPAADLLAEAEENLREMVERRGMRLRTEPCRSREVYADRAAIHQVFTNLIENAAKYSQPGAEISLGCEEKDCEVSFFVRDTGPGIAMEHQPRLFERFYRVDVSRSRESGGTGLGLAIVKHIVLNHRGRVWLESAVNKGSTFYFTLPLAGVTPK